MYPLYSNDETDFELYRRKSVHIGPHLHKSLEIVMILEGSLELGIGEELYHMEKGDLGLVFPELIHHYQVFDDRPCRSLYLLASPVLAGPYQTTRMQLCPENPVVPMKKVHIDVDYALETLTGRRKKKPGDDDIRQAYIMIILARTLPLMTLKEKPTPSEGDLVYRTVSYISAHYSEEDLSLTTMAHDLYVSPFSLSRVFSGTFHMNFSRYVNEVRISYAKHLLAYTDQSVTEILENAGFGSQRTFNRAFRDCVHMTPKEFREASRIQTAQAPSDHFEQSYRQKRTES